MAYHYTELLFGKEYPCACVVALTPSRSRSQPPAHGYESESGFRDAEVMACHVDAIDRAIAALKWQASIKPPWFIFQHCKCI